ncbi:hypothetical protein [Streptomyces lydicus]|uniref:hypothetical protein n=1 Tax=Streptomyces lydicus TaxID=47763 RepID=UPI0037A31FB4
MRWGTPRSWWKVSGLVLVVALTVGADPLHPALVFNLSHTTASRYAAIAQNLLDDRIAQAADIE